MSPNRREFLGTCAAATSALALGCTHAQEPTSFPGRMVGASSGTGHLLRTGVLPEASREERARVVVVGGGVAGLIATRELKRRGVKDVLLFELENETGGKSRFGQNPISAYPWGAHYVPIPNEEAVHVRTLFEELGLTNGVSEDGKPKYREEFLCHEPEERLSIHGRWQTGIVPSIGTGEDDRRQYKELFGYLATLRHQKGADGKPAFAIPLGLSSEDEELRKLDTMSFADFLDSRKWTSPYLRWYTNYCCRDDYGTNENEVSAWAGLHYFAGRRAFGSNVTSSQILTWPEGNGWIIRRLRDDVERQTRTGCLVFSVENDGAHAVTKIFHPASGESLRFRSEKVIFAAPRFMAPYLIADFRQTRPSYLEKLSYAPWAVANITIRGYRDTASFAWDNVSFHSGSLGYVVATHQRLERQGPDTVLTWYLPLSSGAPKAERENALARSLSEWQDMVAVDLRRMHPDILPHIRSIDVLLWGHAMVRPVPGFVWGTERLAMAAPHGHIHFAHSDMSGVSIFEEAQYHGMKAAGDVAGLLAA